MMYPWQNSLLDTLLTRRAAGLPHALLLHGRPGIGKVDFAAHLADALLCEAAPGVTRPCGVCPACQWLAQGSHPDRLVLRPESADAAAAEAEGGESAKEAKEADGGGAAKTRAPSQDIKIAQVRALIDALALPPHRAGLRVVLVYPLEALNGASANALLKTLEEPPARTLFVLVADQVERVLPTILSRCQRQAMPTPDRAQASAWLQAATGLGPAQAETWLDEAGGAPLAARRLAEADDGALREDWLAELAKGPRADWLSLAETMQKTPMARVLDWTQRWVHDLLSLRMTGRTRFYPGRTEALGRCASAVRDDALWAFVQTLQQRRRTERHPLAAKLAMETLLLEYSQLFSDERHAERGRRAGHGPDAAPDPIYY